MSEKKCSYCQSINIQPVVIGAGIGIKIAFYRIKENGEPNFKAKESSNIYADVCLDCGEILRFHVNKNDLTRLQDE